MIKVKQIWKQDYTRKGILHKDQCLCSTEKVEVLCSGGIVILELYDQAFYRHLNLM